MNKKRRRPTPDDIHVAISLAPVVTDDDLNRAIEKTGNSLTDDAKDSLLVGVQKAFARYFHDQIWLALCKRSTSSEVARELKGIASKAEKLLATFGLDDESATRRPAYLRIRLQAGWHGEKLGGFPDLPPRTFTGVRDSDGNVAHTDIDYRGDEKLSQVIDGIELLQQIANEAHKYERAKVEKARKALKEAGKSVKSNRESDKPFHHLIGNLNGCWMDAFEELPGVSRPGKGGEVGGPYIRFLISLFSTLHDRAPAEMDDYAPGLLASLERTPESLSHGFRKTKLSKLRTIAKPDPK